MRSPGVLRFFRRLHLGHDAFSLLSRTAHEPKFSLAHVVELKDRLKNLPFVSSLRQTPDLAFTASEACRDGGGWSYAFRKGALWP